MSVLTCSMNNIKYWYRQRYGASAHFGCSDAVRATHEAGHAIAAMALGYRIKEVSSTNGNAYCLYIFPKLTEEDSKDALRQSLANDTAISLAGDMALDLLDRAIVTIGVGTPVHDPRSHAPRVTAEELRLKEARTDNRAVAEVAKTVSPANRGTYTTHVRQMVKFIFADHRQALDRLALALLRYQVLDEDGVRSVVGRELADNWRTVDHWNVGKEKRSKVPAFTRDDQRDGTCTAAY